MKSSFADRFGPTLTLLGMLFVFLLGGMLDSNAAPLVPDSESATLEWVSTLSPTETSHEAALLQRVHTYGMADVCGEHPDVAPTVQLGTYRALLAALRAEPRLIREACRVWRSYREI